jgi:hypothetical protein
MGVERKAVLRNIRTISHPLSLSTDRSLWHFKTFIVGISLVTLVENLLGCRLNKVNLIFMDMVSSEFLGKVKPKYLLTSILEQLDHHVRNSSTVQ